MVAFYGAALHASGLTLIPFIVSVAASVVCSIGSLAVYAYIRVARAAHRAGLATQAFDEPGGRLRLPRLIPPVRPPTLEEQLTEVERLHAAGALTSDDYDVIRRTILPGPDSVN